MDCIAQARGKGQAGAFSADELQRLADAQTKLVELRRERGLPFAESQANLAMLRRRIEREATA